MNKGKNKMKLYLIKGVSNEGKEIYRYKCDYFGDLNMWRDSEEEARDDIQQTSINWRDNAKGMKEMLLLSEYDKLNKNILVF